jgi:hypothetical protein
MERVTERLRPDSPPKLVMSIVPRLREQKDEIIALLREQTELLRRGRPETIARESKSPGQELLEANTPRCDRLLSSGRVDDDIHPSIHKRAERLRETRPRRPIEIWPRQPKDRFDSRSRRTKSANGVGTRTQGDRSSQELRLTQAQLAARLGTVRELVAGVIA